MKSMTNFAYMGLGLIMALIGLNIVWETTRFIWGLGGTILLVIGGVIFFFSLGD